MTQEIDRQLSDYLDLLKKLEESDRLYVGTSLIGFKRYLEERRDFCKRMIDLYKDELKKVGLGNFGSNYLEREVNRLLQNVDLLEEIIEHYHKRFPVLRSESQESELS